jgi:hypothetical protein
MGERNRKKRKMKGRVGGENKRRDGGKAGW